MIFLFKAIFAVLAALIQISPWFEVSGVKPNLVLIVVISLIVFERELWKKITLILLAALILKSGPTLEGATIVFVLGTLISIPLASYFRLEKEATIGGTVLISIIALNLTNGFSVFLNEKTAVLIEVMYTAALGFVVVPLSRFLYEREKSSKS